MEFVPVGKILKIRPDTEQYIRQMYGFDKPGSLEEAVRILQEWIEKQPHFNKKDFGDHYLEAKLVVSKGSIQRAKAQLDKICTMRTLMPQFFGKYNCKTDFEHLYQVVYAKILLHKYYLSFSVHKILITVAKIIEHYAVLPLRQLSEDTQEARNKDCKSTFYGDSFNAKNRSYGIFGWTGNVDPVLWKQLRRIEIMEAIPSSMILEFNPDTFLHLKQQYDLDKPGRMEDAIKLLEDWLKKQEHFMRKEFPKSYLERTIIFSKGSVERAKHKLDKLCMFRTLFPEIFEVFDIKNSTLLDEIKAGFLPKLTSNHYRVFALKNAAKRYDNRVFDLYRYFIMQCEYIQAHDYCDGVILLLDYSEANIMETMKVFNIVDVRDILRVFKEGYGMRIKGIHFLTGSKTIDMLVLLFKQVLSEKVAGRIKAHATIDTVYEYVPKDILPVEYGGKEKPLIEIHRTYQEVMSSKEFTDYLTEMSHASTDENLRTTEKGDNQMMGASGTFRSLQVD